MKKLIAITTIMFFNIQAQPCPETGHKAALKYMRVNAKLIKKLRGLNETTYKSADSSILTKPTKGPSKK